MTVTPGKAPPGPWDGLQRLLAELCTRSPSVKEGAAAAFRKHVEEEARGLPRLMDTLYDRISSLIDSSDVADNLGALRAIDVLIDIKLGESATKTTRFAGLLKRVFQEKQDHDVLTTASSVLGHLASVGGPQASDIVESQVKCALDWLKPDSVEARLFAAVLILKEMADQAPTVFNVHVPEFVDAIWVALRHPRLVIRERAVEALRSCLTVIVTRETRWRVRWYYRMFEATQDGLGRNASVESIHGSLLAVGELLRNTGEFMMSRYKEVSDIVFKFRDHRDRLVRRSITALLPRIAHFLRDRFVTSYLEMCMGHLLAVMRNPNERASGFAALGEMAGAVGCELKPYLPTIMSLIRDAIQPRRGRVCMEAIACVGQLADALGPAMEEHARNMLEVMFSTGLSSTLVESLNQIESRLPTLLPTIQDRLLDLISQVLCRAPYASIKKGVGRLPANATSLPASDSMGTALVQLALQTLTRFNFKGHDLLDFAKEAVVRYLEEDDAAVRRDAAVCCCRVVEHSAHVALSGTPTRLGASSPNRLFRRNRFLIEKRVAVADIDPSVRKAVLSSLNTNSSFYDFLSQGDSLRAVFIAFNDEGGRNPAYVFPALRRHLQQLLTDLEQGADNKSREESAVLTGCLIKACPALIFPYVAPVHKALVARLNEGAGITPGVIAGVMATVGELARVAGCAITPYLPDLMPLIVDALVDGSSTTKREVALVTLGQLVQSTGWCDLFTLPNILSRYVVTPYTEHPQLLGVLLRLLNGELAWTTRREVLKVLGVMGALDPHIHKRNQLRLQAGDGSLPSSNEGGLSQTSDEFPTEMWPSGGLFVTSEDYYSTVH